MADIKLTPEVTAILQRSTITETLLCLPEGQLERKLYESVAKVIKLAGGVWKTHMKGFLFTGDPRQRLGLIVESGKAIDEKKLLQAFFTPQELATRVVQMAFVNGKAVLEPSAGEGALALECVRQGATRVGCIEINPDSVAVLRKQGLEAIEWDFLKAPIVHLWDAIVMNPPFTKNQDIIHVSRALECLAPGGILVAIMSPRTDRPKFQDLVRGYRHEVTDVPEGAFKESGTSIKTIILRIFK